MIPYSTREEDFLLHYSLPHPKYQKVPTFRWYDAPVLGVGYYSDPIAALDKYIDSSVEALMEEAYEELQANKHLLEPHLKGLVVNGVVPAKYNGGVQSIDELLLSRSRIGFWKEEHEPNIAQCEYLSQIKSYFYQHYKIPEFWRGVCHLREYTTFANKSKPSKWLPYAQVLPSLIRLVERLPFKQLGYALFFVSKPDTPVFLHRDTYVRDHHVSNFINIMLDRKPKPTFVYDSMSDTRYYLSPTSSFYTFNEADIHGVDPEPEERWMLRVEGVFEDWFAEELDMENKEVFNWSYRSGQQFLKSHPEGIKIDKRTNL